MLVWTQNGYLQKWWLKKGTMIGRIGPISHHLGSLLDGIELTVLRAFVCEVIYFDSQVREILVYK